MFLNFSNNFINKFIHVLSNAKFHFFSSTDSYFIQHHHHIHSAFVSNSIFAD